MCTLSISNLEVFEYSAKQIKQAVVGNGAASKYQVQHMVQTLLNLNKKPSEDASDALAIAVCHYHSRKSLIKIEGASKVSQKRLR